MTHYRLPLMCVLLVAFAIGAAPAPRAMDAAADAATDPTVCVAADLGDCITFGSCKVCEIDNMPEGCVIKICPDDEGGETHEVDCGDPK